MCYKCTWYFFTFNAVINEDYSITVVIERYQSALEHILSKSDFSVGIGIYMFQSSLNLSKGKTTGYDNNILRSNTYIKIFSNRNINKVEIWQLNFLKPHQKHMVPLRYIRQKTRISQYKRLYYLQVIKRCLLKTTVMKN